MYPNKFVKYDEERIKIMNTLFELPSKTKLCSLQIKCFFLEIYLLTCVVHMLQNDIAYTKVEHGVKLASVYMSYHSIFEDVEAVVDWMHRVSYHYFLLYFCNV